MNKPEHLQFNVDSQLIGELGERLVTNNYVALSELIKNAYDADSTDALISLKNIKKGNKKPGASKIVVEDHGVGMTFEQVRDQWMRIATANKLISPESIVYGRSKTGNKGIGRFACQRLAKNLILITTAKKGKMFETTTVVFKWRNFKTGTNLTEIDCDYITHRKKTGKTGTCLKLIGLRDLWTQRDFNMLQKNISLLSLSRKTRRKGFEEDPGFKTNVIALDFEDKPFDLKQKYLNSGWGTLSGSVKKNGLIDLKLSALNTKPIQYQPAEQFELLEGMKFTIHFMPQGKEMEVRRDPSILTNEIRNKLLEVHSGIRLYLDGFRIYPYGESGNDWLGIDKDVSARLAGIKNPELKEIAEKMKLDSSRSLLKHPANRNTIGSITIERTRKNPFVVKMDREGLVDNKAFTDLKAVIRLALEWLTIHYEAFTVKLRKHQNEESKRQFEQAIGIKDTDPKKGVNEAIGFLKMLATGISEDSSALHETNLQKRTTNDVQVDNSKNIEIAANLISSKIDVSDSELMLLRSVAATGPLMFVFAHEVKGITNSLSTHAAFLDAIKKDIPDITIQNELSDISESFRNTKQRFDLLSRLFNVFSSSQSQDPRKIPINGVIDNTINGFSFVLSEFKIDVDSSGINPVLTTPDMNEAEFYTLIVNLLSNAVKAVIAGNGGKIKITAKKENSLIKICFFDDGAGISKKHWNTVFEPLVTDPENKIYQKLDFALHDNELSSLGRGSGLGLNIVKSIVESKNGSVRFIDTKDKWNTCICMKLPIIEK